MSSLNEAQGKSKQQHGHRQGYANGTNGDASSGNAAHNGKANDRHGYVFENLPQDLRDLLPWGVWLREYQNGKLKHVPYDAKTGRNLSITDPETWSKYEVALNTYCRGLRGQWDGLSAVLKERGGIIGLDIDDCVDENGELTPEAQDIANLWGSYLEYSPNRRGIRGFAYGTLPEGRRKVGNLEIYDGAKALTVTGWHIPGTRKTLEERTAAIHEIHKKYFTKPTKQHAKGTFNPDDYEPLTDEEVIDLALRAKNGARVQALMDGDFSGYASNSEADLAACNYLAFYCGPDSHEQIDRIFRASFSGFRPDKWDTRHYGNGDTYGQHTIKVALEDRTEFYTRRRTPTSDPDALPEIIVNNQHLRDLLDESLRALQEKNTPPVLFERASVLVKVQRDERNQPFLCTVSEPVLRESLTRSADFMKIAERKGEQKTIRVSPPRDVVQTMHARGSWQLPALVGLCECPVLRPDGTILEKPGYDPATMLFYDPAASLTMLPLFATPTQPHAQADALFLLSELLVDFPFCAPADKANMLACLLTPIVRPAIKGCVPLCLIDKPGPGSGATLLADVVATITTGMHAAKEMMPAGRNSEEEMRKRITSLLMAAKDVVVLDNIENALASSALSAVLTTPLWQDRVLSKNEIITLPVRTTWIATANNIAIRGDIARRSYRVRIDPKQDRPWTRDTFKHADLLAWTREHRGELLHALLTMARSWFAAGKPKPQVKPPKIGGFEEWVSTIGGILAYAGVEGFLGNLEELYSMVDEDAQQWRVFIATWHEELGEQPVTVAEIAGFAGENPALMEALLDVIDWDTEKFESSKKKLGKALKKRIDRHFGEYRLEQDRDDTHAKVSRWRVKKSGVCGV